MELDAGDGHIAVGQTHDQAVVALGGDRQARRQRGAVHHQGMIASGIERIGYAREHRVAGVSDRTDLAVHGHRRAHDFAAESLTDRLQS